MKKALAFFALIMVFSQTIHAQVSSPAFKITYATIQDNVEPYASHVTHEIYVNDHKIKILMPTVFPTRIFLADKKDDQGLLVYPGRSSYIIEELVNTSTKEIKFIPNKTKNIAGYNCKLAQMKLSDMDENLEEEETLDIWYSEDLPQVYWSNFDELKDIPGAMLEISRADGTSLSAISVQPAEIKAQDFIIPEDYQEIDELDKPDDKFGQIAEEVFIYEDPNTGLYGLQDEDQKKLTAAEYQDFGTFHNGLVSAQYPNQKFGVIDLSGTTVIPFEYDFVMKDDFTEQFMAGINEKYGLLDKKGNIVIPLMYEYISFLNNGYAMFRTDEKFGLINAKNEVVIPATYSVIVSNNGTHFITIDEDYNYALVDIQKNKILASGYDYISISDEPNLFLAQKDGQFGFLNNKGDVAIPLIYSNASDFVDGKAYVITSSDEAIFINTKGEKVGTVDEDTLEDAATEDEALRVIEETSLEAIKAAEGR